MNVNDSGLFRFAGGAAMLMLVGILAGAVLMRTGAATTASVARGEVILPTRDGVEDESLELIRSLSVQLDRLNAGIGSLQQAIDHQRDAIGEFRDTVASLKERLARLEMEAATPRPPTQTVELAENFDGSGSVMDDRMVTDDETMRGEDRSMESSGGESAEAEKKSEASATPDGVEAEQCTAITQKGTRCKRKATSNGKCWQHDE